MTISFIATSMNGIEISSPTITAIVVEAIYSIPISPLRKPSIFVIAMDWKFRSMTCLHSTYTTIMKNSAPNHFIRFIIPPIDTMSCVESL